MGTSKLNPLTPRTPLPSQVVKDDEGSLVAAAKSGDINAFETLVGRYERKIFRLAQNITQNKEDAEDVMQEAFLKSYQHLGRVPGKFAVLYLAGAHRRESSSDEAAEAPPQSGFVWTKRWTLAKIRCREKWRIGDLRRRNATSNPNWGDFKQHNCGTRAAFPNRFSTSRHRRIVNRGDGGSTGTLGSGSQVKAVARAPEAAPEVESLFSTG